MPRQVLGAAVDGDVSPQFQRPQQVGGEEGVVDDAKRPPVVAEGRQTPDVRHLEERVGEGLDEQRPGVLLPGRGDCRLVAGVHVGEGQAELLEDLLEQAVSAAVEVFGHQQVVAPLKEEQQAGDGGHAGRIGEPSCSAVQAGDPLFQCLTGGVAGAAVVEAGALAQAGVAEGCGLVDRDGDGPGPGVPVETDVSGGGGELRHGETSLKRKFPFRFERKGNMWGQVRRFLICRNPTVSLDLAPALAGGCCDVNGPVPRSLSIRRGKICRLMVTFLELLCQENILSPSY